MNTAASNNLVGTVMRNNPQHEIKIGNLVEYNNGSPSPADWIDVETYIAATMKANGDVDLSTPVTFQLDIRRGSDTIEHLGSDSFNIQLLDPIIDGLTRLRADLANMGFLPLEVQNG